MPLQNGPAQWTALRFGASTTVGCMPHLRAVVCTTWTFITAEALIDIFELIDVVLFGATLTAASKKVSYAPCVCLATLQCMLIMPRCDAGP